MSTSVLDAKILDAVFSLEGVGASCSLHRLEADDGQTYRQAVIDLAEDLRGSLTLTLPDAKSRSIFLMASEAPPDLIRRLLAYLEQVNESRHLVVGNLVPLDAPELRERFVGGVLLLPVSTSNLLASLPAVLSLEGADYSCLLVVFLTFAEIEVWQKSGHDALMDLFELEEKDLFAF
jgi:hypothetical protein